MHIFNADVVSNKVGQYPHPYWQHELCCANQMRRDAHTFLHFSLIPQIKAQSLRAISKEICHSVARATVRELNRPDLCEKVYVALTECSKVYGSDVQPIQPNLRQLHAMRDALRAIIDGHYTVVGVAL